MNSDTTANPTASEESSLHGVEKRSEDNTAKQNGTQGEKSEIAHREGSSTLDELGSPHTLKQTQKTRSYGDGHGYTCFGEDVEAAKEDERSQNYEGKHFEVKWDENDSGHPKNLSKTKKWAIVFIVSAGSTCVTTCSSIYTLDYNQVTQEFHCSRIVATLGLSLFVMGLGLAPMILGPLSEFYGRRPVYILSFIFFLIFLIPCACAQNIQTILIARFLDGLAGSAFLSVAGGSVGDMFVHTELQAPMLVFTASPFIGPPIGPVIGGFVNSYTTWRWTFYLLMIWSAVMIVLIIAFVPETYSPVLLRQKAIKLRKEKQDDRYKAPIEIMQRSISQTVIRSCYRPFLLLALEPMCLNLCLFSAILLGVLYLFFGAFEVVFENNHGFNTWQIGLTFTGLLVGQLFALSTQPLWQRNYLRLIRAREAAGGDPGSAEPEYRLPPAILGALLVPLGLFWFAWTTYPSIHWIVPIIGSAIFAAGMLLVFSGIFTFLVAAYPLYAASALAANSFARSSFAAAFPLFGVQMYERLGYQWATTLLAFLTVAMAPFPWVFYRWGKRIRGTSRFAGGK